jgi:hypothetical protein
MDPVAEIGCDSQDAIISLSIRRAPERPGTLTGKLVEKNFRSGNLVAHDIAGLRAVHDFAERAGLRGIFRRDPL